MAECRDLIKNPRSSIRKRGFFLLISMILVYYLSLVGFYSYSLYPYLPHGLGGGKPAPIIIWIDKKDFPKDIQENLTKAKFTSSETVIKCESIYLLHDDSKILIIADADLPPASCILIPRDKVKAISW